MSLSSRPDAFRAGRATCKIRNLRAQRASFSPRSGPSNVLSKYLKNTPAQPLGGQGSVVQSGAFHTSPLRINAIQKRLVSSSSSSSSLAASPVPVLIDGTHHDFSALLLRDLCECPSCVHESSKQRLYSTADIPPEIKARTVKKVESDPNSVAYTWTHDAPGFDETHTTVLSLDALRELGSVGAVSGPFQKALDHPVTWGRDDDPARDVSFADYMSDDVALQKGLKHLHTHGLLFVTGIPEKEDALVDIATRIGPMKDTFYGLTWDVRTVPSAINAAYTANDLGFHTDLLYFQNPPHIQLLHCIQSSSNGGASVFADAFRSAVELLQSDPKAFDILASVPVNYHYNHPDANLYHTTKTVFELRPLMIGETTYRTVSEYLDAWEQEQVKGRPLPDISLVDCLEKVNWGPPFMAPFTLQEQSDQPAYSSFNSRKDLNRKMDRWHAAARKFSAMLHRPESLYERLLKPGECVLFNNTRTLHARRAFNHDDLGKTRWLKGGYVDKDPFLSKLRVLDVKLT